MNAIGEPLPIYELLQTRLKTNGISDNTEIATFCIINFVNFSREGLRMFFHCFVKLGFVLIRDGLLGSRIIDVVNSEKAVEKTAFVF